MPSDSSKEDETELSTLEEAKADALEMAAQENQEAQA